MNVNSIIKGTLVSALAILACGLSVPAHAQAKNSNNAIIQNNASGSAANDNAAIDSEQTTLSYGAAESGAPTFTVKGMGRFRLEERKNITLGTTGAANNKQGQMLMKIRPEMTWAPDSEVSVVVAPQFARTLGFGTQTGANGAATSGGTTDEGFDVHYGYIDYHPTEMFKIMAGRQILSYGNELVVGALEWNNVGRSFDAVRGRVTLKDMGWIDAFVSRINETSQFGATAAAQAAGDTDFYGLYSNWNLGEYLKNLDVYLLDVHNPTRLTQETNVVAYGARVQSAISGLDYRAELTLEKNPFLGATTDSGSQFDIEVGYTLDMAIKPRFGVEFATSSENYNQFFPTTHKWLGYADIFGRRNIQDIVIHTSWGWTEAFSSDIDAHLFSRTKDSAPLYNTSGTAYGTAGTNKGAGTEIDLTLKYQATKMLAFVGGASVLFSGQYLKDNYTDQMDKPYFGFLQMETKF